MKSLTWSPAWHREGESFWSFVNKIADANFLSVSEVVLKLTGVARPHQRCLFLSVSVELAVAVCQALRLSASVALELFTRLGAVALIDRQYLSLGLRWCPVCLRQGFHSGIFQDWRLWTCPWHGETLLERCPKCLRTVDPLGDLPWSCNHCQHQLFSPGQGWLLAFRMPMDFEWSHPQIAALLQIEEVKSSPVDTHYHAKGLFPEVLSPDKVALATQATEWAYEEAAALVSSLLYQHRDCFPGEMHSSVMQLDPVRFSCPVAAAVTRVGAWFDFQAIGVSGHWIGGARPISALVNSWLEWELQDIPAWARRLYVRENFRAWLVGAVAGFKAADALGLQSVSWRPLTASGATLTSVDDKVVLKSHCDWPGFSALVEQGSISCAACRRL